MVITSRRQAHEQGLRRYFTGQPCRNGHVSERYVSSGNCCDCGLFKRIPSAHAPNAAMPPSPYVFPGWVPVTPELVSAVHALVLQRLPDMVNEIERTAGKYLPLKSPYYMTEKANGATREQFVAAGWTDRDLLEAGYVALGTFRPS